MFGGLGFPEVAMLLLLGLFVFGPERLPTMAQEAARTLRKLRVYLKSMSEELKAELGPEVGSLNLRSLDPKEFVRKHLFEDEQEQPLVAKTVTAGARLLPGQAPPWDPDTT